MPRSAFYPLPRTAHFALAAHVRPLVPGLLLVLTITLGAMLLRHLSGIAALSPLMVAIVIGMAVRMMMPVPAAAVPGIRFAMRPLLRAGIVLLGAQLTFAQVSELGVRGILVTVLTAAASFLFAKVMGRWLGVERRLAELIAAGTAICGASAVLATDTVTRADEEDVAYAVACVTVFGSLSMILFPLLLPLLHISEIDFGLWSGGAIHEVAQVVASSFQVSKAAGEHAMVTKLFRVMLLAPLVAALAFSARTGRDGAQADAAGRPPLVPTFIVGFLVMIALNSFGAVPETLKAPLAFVTTVLLACGLAAMGLETSVGKLRAKGASPMLLGALSWLFISCFSLGLVALTAP